MRLSSCFVSRSLRRFSGGLLGALVALALAATAPALAAQQPARDPSPHSNAELVSDVTSASAGGTVTVAVRLTLDAGWHTYWSNPGDAGLPLEVKWTLPAGVTAGPLQFPTPRLTPQPPLMSYGYEREVFVLAELTIPASFTGPLQVTGSAEWLACAEVCLPAKGPLALSIPVGPPTSSRGTRWTSAINAARAQLPTEASTWTMRSWVTPKGYVLAAIAPPGVIAALTTPYFFVDSANVIEHADAQRVARAGDTIVLSLPRAKIAPTTIATVRGILAADVTASAQRGWLLTAPVLARAPDALGRRAEAMLVEADVQRVGGADTQVAAADGSASTVPDPSAELGLIFAIVFAFAGGLLLNLMPCVFPVLSVKVLALLEHGGAVNASSGRKHGLVFGLGVLLSFWALAGVLMALRAGGESLGWGFQLQSPPVVALLALLMFALALNLSGVFEIGLSLTRLGNAGAGRGYADSLLTGGLAVLVAAPCTAPFMGTALGYALVQPPLIGLTVFTALGVGLALPFVVLASAPRLLRFLPRPGPWLETLKQLFAFPLYVTVVWLLWVFGQQTGVDALAIILLAMILLALGAWLWARGVRSDRGVTRSAAAAVMALAVGIAAFSGREAAASAAPTSSTIASTGSWEPYSAQRVSALRAEGRPVFVDFTAAWCLSCQVNERVALRTDAVVQAFQRANVALLRADWTSRNDEITQVLASFGRSGVPLYVLYPSTPSGSASILPAVLTPGIIIDAVEKAVQPPVATGAIR